MSRRTPTSCWVVVPVALTGLLLGGCATPPADLTAEAAADLQAAVLDVADAAEQGRFDAAREAAEQVRAALEEAAQDGDISVARYALIDDALSRTLEQIDLADAEAEAAAAAARKAAEPTPTATSEATSGGSKASGPGEKAPKPKPPKGKEKGKGKGKP